MAALPILTSRQQEILLHCIARGYYEIPRRSTLRSLAKDLDIPTTLSLVLRRAERTVIKHFTGTRQPAQDLAVVPSR